MRPVFTKLPTNGIILLACVVLLISITKYNYTLATVRTQSPGGFSTTDKTTDPKGSQSQSNQGTVPQNQPVTDNLPGDPTKPPGSTTGSTGTNNPAPGVNQAVYKHLIIRKGPGGVKQVALTFDDGPDNKYTKQILDILKQNNVKGTFFVLGQQVNKYPEVVKRMVYEGHAIGNHTWGHINMTHVTPEQLKYQIESTNQAVYKAAGVTPKLVRPPFGNTNPSITEQIFAWGYQVVLWSVDSRDWSGVTTDQIMKNVRKDMTAGGIILQHSAGGRKNDLNNTIRALPMIINELKAQGYTFVTVPEMLKVTQS